MNPFEKIFNYQLVERLKDAGAFMITAHERGWLKEMLRHPASREAFAPETLLKLEAALAEDSYPDVPSHLLHKAASRELHVYHPFIRPLRQAIMNRQLVRLSYTVKNAVTHSGQDAFPYKLEYSMVKREWYLLWYHIRHRKLMNTKLKLIASVSLEPCGEEHYGRLLARTLSLLEKQRKTADIRVMRSYNEELSRILYAFSCFEKEVRYDEAADEYTIRLTFPAGETEFVLLKTRFLGKRVRILEDSFMKNRMRESASKALERYRNDSGKPGG